MQKIDINIQPSQTYLLILSVFFLSSVSIVFLLPVSFGIKVGLMLIVGLYLSVIIWNEALLKSSFAIQGLTFNGEHWELHTKNSLIIAKVCGSSTLTGFVSILRFQDIRATGWSLFSKKYSVLIFRDSVLKDEYRRLLVKLRTAG